MKEQSITITASDRMSDLEVEQAMRDAAEYAGLDALRVEVLELSREAQTTWSKAQQLLKDEKKTMKKNRKKQLKKDSDALQKALSRLRVDKVTPEQIENIRQAKAQLENTLG